MTDYRPAEGPPPRTLRPGQQPQAPGNDVEIDDRPHQRHAYSSLIWHYGQYGPQDVHVHSCQNEGCDWVLIGLGRECVSLEDHEARHLRSSPLGLRKKSKAAEPRLQTVTVEVTMEVKGDLRRFVDSALSSIPTRGGRKEWTYLDA